MQPPLQHPAVPVEALDQVEIRAEIEQQPLCQLLADLQLGDETAGQPLLGHGDEGLRRAHRVAGVAAGGQGEVAGHEADVHVVALIEGDRRCLGQRRGGEPAGEVTGDEGGAGGQQVAHLAELVDAAAGQGLRLQADGAERLALAHLVEGAALVIHQQVQLYGVLFQQGGQGGQKPGGQAVGVDGYADPDRRLGLAGGDFARQLQFQLAYLTVVGQQLLPEGRGLQGLAADDQRLGKLLLQLLDALGDGGLGDVQTLGGALEVLLLHHGIQRQQQLVVQRLHQHSLSEKGIEQGCYWSDGGRTTWPTLAGAPCGVSRACHCEM